MKVHCSARLSPKSVLAAALAVAIGLPALAAAQQQPPLAEVARKEAERRKTVKTTQKVITTKDLPESAKRTGPPPSTETAAPSSAGHGGAEQSAAPGGQPAADAKPAPTDKGTEEQWRSRISQAREAVRRSESFAEALQSRINALTRDFVNRDNPVQRSQIGEDRVKALAELERVRAEIVAGKKAISDIEEEARKAGVPPGWLR